MNIVNYNKVNLQKNLILMKIRSYKLIDNILSQEVKNIKNLVINYSYLNNKYKKNNYKRDKMIQQMVITYLIATFNSKKTKSKKQSNKLNNKIKYKLLNNDIVMY